MRKRALIQIILVIQEPQNKTGKGGNLIYGKALIPILKKSDTSEQ